MTEKKEIDEIIDKAGELAQVAQPLRRMKVRSGDIAVELEWARAAPAGGSGGSSHRADTAGEPAATAEAPAAEVAAVAPADGSSSTPGPDADAGRAHICAPLVGTFYHAPKPGEPPFVRPGDTVEAGQQVGILEAMKLMNPIEAEQPGVVAEILVPDGTGVEYGQPLIAFADPDS